MSKWAEANRLTAVTVQSVWLINLSDLWCTGWILKWSIQNEWMSRSKQTHSCNSSISLIDWLIWHSWSSVYTILQNQEMLLQQDSDEWIENCSQINICKRNWESTEWSCDDRFLIKSSYNHWKIRVIHIYSLIEQD